MSKAKPVQYGTGSIYQRRSDGRWFAAIQAGWTNNGTRRTITRSAKTEPEARRKLEQLRRDLARDGIPAQGTHTNLTVKTWADRWIQHIVTDLRPRSYASTIGAVKNWIIPSIGAKRLDALTPGDIRTFHQTMRDGGLSQATMVRHHSVLMSMLKAAMTEGPGYRVPANVIQVKPPKLGENDRTNMQLDQAIAVLQVAASQPDGCRWAAALLQAIRQGERNGLLWDMVDFRDNEIDISWQLQPLPYNVRYDTTSGFRVPDGFVAKQLVGAWHLTRPKTASGTRIIPMVPWMRSALLAWRQNAPTSPYGLVWPEPDGTPRQPKDDQAAWHALQAAAGVHHPTGRPYTGHETRHTTISLLNELEVDRATIAAIVGQAKLVDSYVHVSHKQSRRALERVAKRLQLN